MRLLYFDIPRTNNHLHKISKKDHRKSYRLSAAFFVFWVTESINNILIMDINEKKNEIRAIESSLCFLHDKHLSGVLGDAEYSRLRKIKTAMLDEAEESLELLRRKHETSQTVSNGNNSWMDIFKEYQNICVLKREAVALFVKNIVFSSNKAVEINFIYQTELEELNKISDNLKSEQDACSEAV